MVTWTKLREHARLVGRVHGAGERLVSAVQADPKHAAHLLHVNEEQLGRCPDRLLEQIASEVECRRARSLKLRRRRSGDLARKLERSAQWQNDCVVLDTAVLRAIALVGMPGLLTFRRGDSSNGVPLSMLRKLFKASGDVRFRKAHVDSDFLALSYSSVTCRGSVRVRLLPVKANAGVDVRLPAAPLSFWVRVHDAVGRAS